MARPSGPAARAGSVAGRENAVIVKVTWQPASTFTHELIVHCSHPARLAVHKPRLASVRRRAI